MDKIAKYLKRLSGSDLQAVESAIVLLLEGKRKQLNIKKLRGHTDIYRVRVGETRIIYREVQGKIVLLDIARRNEHTYK